MILADAVVWDSAASLPLQLHSTSTGPSLQRHQLTCTNPDRRAGGILRLCPLENGNGGQRQRPLSLGLDVKGAFTHKEAARGTVWAKNTFPLKLRKSDQALLGSSAFRFSGWKELSPGHPQDGAGRAHIPPCCGSCPGCPSPQGLCNGFTVTSTVWLEPSSSPWRGGVMLDEEYPQHQRCPAMLATALSPWQLAPVPPLSFPDGEARHALPAPVLVGHCACPLLLCL